MKAPLSIPFYPLKVTSRSLPPARTTRLRISWFALGLLAGIGGTLAVLNWHPPVGMSEVPIAEEPEDTLPMPDIVSAPVTLSSDGAPGTEAAYPLTLTLKVESGDTLISILTDAGAPYDEAHNLYKAIGKIFNVKRIGIGWSITVEMDKGEDGKPIIRHLVLPTSATASLEITRGGDGKFDVKKIQAPVEKKLRRSSGKIDSSLYETGVAQGIPPALLADIITAYSYDVDFQRDIQRGDAIDVLYERMETEDGAVAAYGNILFAELTLGKKPLRIYRYVDKSGHADYYNEKGESVRKALLKTPIPGARITSRFGTRTHPILGYSKMHRGVDFGAPTGTPVYAAGDGTVDFAGTKGGYGKYLRLKHGNGYSTAYAHLSRFAKGMASGKKVKQGQIVAYVGSTGLSTGPHLHYEVLVKGAQVNPSGVKFKTGNVLTGKDLASFKQNKERVEAQLAAPDGAPTDIAMVSRSAAAAEPPAR